MRKTLFADGRLPKISLTQFVRKPAVSECLRAAIKLPISRRANSIRVPPGYSGEEMDYALLGYGYEYWLRLVLTGNGKRALSSLVGYKYRRLHLSFDGSYGERLTFRRHEATISSYRHEKRYSRRLFRSCLHFAYYETEYRDPLRVWQYGTVLPDFIDAKYIDELDALARGADVQQFPGGRSMSLCPVFDLSGSRGTIQGDGDFIIGSMLFDVKVVRTFKIATHMNQLVGYWALDELAKKAMLPPNQSELTHLALYFPRFDQLEQFAIDELMSSRARRCVLSMFSQYLGKGIRHDISRLEFEVPSTS